MIRHNQRSASLMATAMEHAIAKNRRFRWPEPSSSSRSTNPIRPRHFASTAQTTNKLKPNPSSSSSNNAKHSGNAAFHSLRVISSSQERDTKIVPTLALTVLVGTMLLPDDWGIGKLNEMLEDNTKSSGGKMAAKVDGGDGGQHDNTLPRLLESSASSMTSESSAMEDPSSTVGLDYAEDSVTIEGIHVPVGCKVKGIYLDRHGRSALRCFAFFRGISIRVYVATLYSSQQFSSGPEILQASFHEAPLQMDFTFLRGFTAGQCKMAWEKQLDESVSYQYDGFDKDKAEFLEMIATQPMKANGTATVQIQDDRTLIFDQDTYTGEVVGKDFQRAFLSMWFGDKPVTDELKSGLLGQG